MNGGSPTNSPRKPESPSSPAERQALWEPASASQPVLPRRPKAQLPYWQVQMFRPEQPEPPWRPVRGRRPRG